jgi:lysophospholipase L1-like esterase
MFALPPAPPAIVSRSPSPSPAPRAGPWIAAPRPWKKEEWLVEHARFVGQGEAGNVDVLFLGDSIAAFFPKTAPDTWNGEIASLGTVLDFGISGDRTQFVLWRVQHGELDRTNARVVVLLIGTNNLASATPQNVARGIAAILRTIQAKLPNTVVVLNALLPRGPPNDRLRGNEAIVNALIAPLADGVHVRWVDAGGAFLYPDGTIAPALMPDKLHPSAAGYEVWATALRPVLLDALSK